MDKRTSIEVSTESYLDLLARGNRAGYLRMAVDQHLELVRAAYAVLKHHGTDGMLRLLDAADMSWAQAASSSDLAMLSPEEQEALALLWTESEATGLSGRALLDAVESKRCA